MMVQGAKGTPLWYAMSSPYGREMKAIDTLKTISEVNTFIPLQRYERMVGCNIRKRVVSYRPVVRNLLFVQATESKMRDLKKEYNYLLHFKVRPIPGGGFQPVIVPNKQMADFMKLYENVDEEKLEFFRPEDIELRPEAKVRIEDGMFAGVEGYFQRVKGKRAKRFVVRIEGFLACAAFLTECNYVSCCDND